MRMRASGASSSFSGRGNRGRQGAAVAAVVGSGGTSVNSSNSNNLSRLQRTSNLARQYVHSSQIINAFPFLEEENLRFRRSDALRTRAINDDDAATTSSSSSSSSPSPSSSPSTPSSSSPSSAQRDLELLRRAQAKDDGRTYPLDETKRLVDTAMLSAIGGLAYALGSVLRLQAYMGYLLPMPVVVAGGRWGAGATWQTAASTSLLVLMLLGPVQSLTYALNYGWPSAALGACWATRRPWQAAVAAGVAARVVGVAGYVALTSWTLGEDLLQLLLSNVCALLDQLATLLGTSAGSPPPAAVGATLAAVLAVNSAAHVAVLHILYSALLRAVGLRAPPMPAWVARRVGVPAV